MSGCGVFWKLLFVWKASVYKVVWTNLLLYIVLYSGLSITYRFLLQEDQKVNIYLYVYFLKLLYFSLDNFWEYLHSLSDICWPDSCHFCSWFLCLHYCYKVNYYQYFCSPKAYYLKMVGSIQIHPLARLLLSVHLHMSTWTWWKGTSDEENHCQVSGGCSNSGAQMYWCQGSDVIYWKLF